jgi:hypothetical protein
VTVGAVFVVSGAGKSTNHESELASSKACHLPALDTFVYLTGMIELVGGLLPPRSRGSGVRRDGCSRADRPDCMVAGLSDLTALPYQTVLGGLSGTGGCDWGRSCWGGVVPAVQSMAFHLLQRDVSPCRMWRGWQGWDWSVVVRRPAVLRVAGVRARRPQRGASGGAAPVRRQGR